MVQVTLKKANNSLSYVLQSDREEKKKRGREM